MLRLILILLLVGLGSPCMAKSSGTPPSPTATPMATQPAPLDAATQNYIRALERERDIDRMRAELQAANTGWFEILISLLTGFFSLVVTVAVIFLALRTKDAAVAEARQSVQDIRDKLMSMAAEGEQHVDNVRQRSAAISDILARLEGGDLPESHEDRRTILDAARIAEAKPATERNIEDLQALSIAGAMTERAASDDLIARFSSSEDPSVQGRVARALFENGIRLASLGRSEEALSAYSDLIAQFGDNKSSAVREQVAKALLSKGVTLGTLGRSEEAIAIYDDLIARFGDDDGPAFLELVSGALNNKGVRYGTLGRVDDEIAAYDEVIKRLGAIDGPTLHRVATALNNRGIALIRCGRIADAIANYRQFDARFGNRTDPQLNKAVTGACFNEACALALAGQTERAIARLRDWNTKAGTFDCEKVASDHDFDIIRGDPRFAAFLAEMNCGGAPSS